MSTFKLNNGLVVNSESEIVHSVPGKKSTARKGYVLYKGPSVLDKAPIVVIATMSTANDKTGDMIQTWIMREDVSPLEASAKKLDSSVCGMCPHRTSLNGACYVTLHQAPLSVWKSYKKGNYKDLDSRDLVHFAGRHIRLGSYGDPAAVPFEVWQNMVNHTQGNTGYTHQIHHKNFDHRIATICQISADTEKQAITAWRKGYKTFRVKTPNMRRLEGEITCVNTTHNISCLDCGLCDGKRANVVIDVHGRSAKRFDKFERII